MDVVKTTVFDKSEFECQKISLLAALLAFSAYQGPNVAQEYSVSMRKIAATL